MDRYEKAALLDFVASVVWPSRTVRLVTAPGGEATFDVVGTWATGTDLPMAWINGNRVSGAITWVDSNTVTLPVTAALGSQVIIIISPGSGSGYLPRNPGAADMLGALSMANFTISNLGAAVSGHQAVRKDQVISLIQAQLGGNYLAKAGDTATGAIKLAAAILLTDAAAAVRRDMVALLDGSQPFTGKIRGVSTGDGDNALTLTTKDWVIAYVTAQLAAAQPPNQTATFQNGGTGYSWTVPAGVRKIWVYVKGAKGGRGGRYTAGPDSTNIGGIGGFISGSIPVLPAAILPVVVGANGADGGDFWEDRHACGSGGGGGGASQVTVGDQSITGGGGGGGNGQGSSNSNTASTGPAGGAGGAAGGNGRTGGGGVRTGGLPGNSIQIAGGVGGASSRDPKPGGNGSGANTPSFNTSDTFPFQSFTDPNLASGVGLVVIKWYQ